MEPELTFIVEPDDLQALPDRRRVVMAVNSVAAVNETAAQVHAAGHELVCLRLESDLPLSRLAFSRDWLGVPLAIGVPELGPYRDLSPLVPLLQSLDLRISLPMTSARAAAELILLASLDIAVCADMPSENLDWASLMVLARYALARPATSSIPIEPITSLTAVAPQDWPTLWPYLALFHGESPGRTGESPRNVVSCYRCPAYGFCNGSLWAPNADDAPCFDFFTTLADRGSQRRLWTSVFEKGQRRWFTRATP